MRLTNIASILILATVITSGSALGWGPDGHHSIGEIADRLLVGSNAENQVKAILGEGLTLRDAAVWADCAKGVDPSKNYSYVLEQRYPECRIFETAQGEAQMADFVKRNDKNCNPKPGEVSCHKQYHYADIAVQRDGYSLKYTGSRNDDVVQAVIAAVRVLKGQPAPAPFNFKDKREALLLLSHYVGDIHQPLHVGAVYLDAAGKKVDPDKDTFDPKTDTRGGNDLTVGKRNLHSTWDSIPAKLKNASSSEALLTKAKATPVTSGTLDSWPATWAGETVVVANVAFKGVTFGNHLNGRWSTTLPANYNKSMNLIKEDQVLKAGARLAQLLKSIWP